MAPVLLLLLLSMRGDERLPLPLASAPALLLLCARQAAQPPRWPPVLPPTPLLLREGAQPLPLTETTAPALPPGVAPLASRAWLLLAA
jgi:hypothetical protein